MRAKYKNYKVQPPVSKGKQSTEEINQPDQPVHQKNILSGPWVSQPISWNTTTSGPGGAIGKLSGQLNPTFRLFPTPSSPTYAISPDTRSSSLNTPVAFICFLKSSAAASPSVSAETLPAAWKTCTFVLSSRCVSPSSAAVSLPRRRSLKTNVAARGFVCLMPAPPGLRTARATETLKTKELFVGGTKEKVLRRASTTLALTVGTTAKRRMRRMAAVRRMAVVRAMRRP
ncbi:hypothetical protein BRADI_4g21961v3 [Brachypodium distachyon]|uniref:Uncharacterized protein n=1 Tax=Brachypodium distachyon TaxID=15368 RepID=A0A2K2CPC0_BRADI|nr:hypothetical protein BRADI_4g21961v3 [Brachypodium distachyon]